MKRPKKWKERVTKKWNSRFWRDIRKTYVFFQGWHNRRYATLTKDGGIVMNPPEK